MKILGPERLGDQGLVPDQEESGNRAILALLSDPEVADQTGLYYDSCAVKEASKLARDEALARELWEKSEAWVR